MDGVEQREPIRLQLPLKQRELAQAIVVPDSCLSRLLKELEQDGVIERNRGWIIVRDPEKLYR